MDKNQVYDEPLYYIGIVAKMVDLHPQTLRNYERLGLIEPQRTDGNVRLYSQQDVERLRKITRLTDELGVNLAGVEVILNLLERLDEMQQQLEMMQAAVEAKWDEQRLKALAKQVRDSGS